MVKVATRSDVTNFGTSYLLNGLMITIKFRVNVKVTAKSNI